MPGLLSVDVRRSPRLTPGHGTDAYVPWHAFTRALGGCQFNPKHAYYGCSRMGIWLRGESKRVRSANGAHLFRALTPFHQHWSLLVQIPALMMRVVSGNQSGTVLDFRHAPLSSNRPGVPRRDCLDGYYPDNADCSGQSPKPAASRSQTRSPECGGPKLG